MKTHIMIFIILCLSMLSFEALAEKMTCNARQSDYNCLVCNCYHETRGEPFEGMVAVAKVVLARFESRYYPNDVCKVVFQPWQFSWTPNTSDNAVSATKSEDKEALEKCKKAVQIALNEGGNDVLYYYNPDEANPRWAKSFKHCGTIENHAFMTPKDIPCPERLGTLGRQLLPGSKSNNSSNKGRK